MRLEFLPVILGALVALLGVGLVVDALTPDGTIVGVERRRRPRAPRHPRGELLVGLGVLAIAAALIGRDAWRWGTVAVLGGVLLVTAGALLNRHFLAELFSFRGALSRTDEGVVARPTGGPARTPTPAAGPRLATRGERPARRPVVVEDVSDPTVATPLPKRPPERRASPRGGDGPPRPRS